MTLTPYPGDVWAVWTGDHLAQRLIRAGEELEGKPAVANHVVGVSHQDKHGTWWGLEGRPGGFGPVQLAKYMNSEHAAWGNSNAAQPRSPQDRVNICRLAAAMAAVHTQYDWTGGIEADALDALGAHDLADRLDEMWGWNDPATSLLPGVSVCSSAYDWIYEKLGLPCPKGGERCEPADWWAFNAGHAWVPA